MTGKKELVELLSPHGTAGAEALKELARTIPDPDAAATAIDALFDSDPASAAVISEERLARSLDARCVPGGLVKAMVRNRLDPFRPIERRLSELDCDRRRLRPDDPIASWQGEETETPSLDHAARTAAAGMSPGKCRKSFEELFGLDKPALRERPRLGPPFPDAEETP